MCGRLGRPTRVKAISTTILPASCVGSTMTIDTGSAHGERRTSMPFPALMSGASVLRAICVSSGVATRCDSCQACPAGVDGSSNRNRNVVPSSIRFEKKSLFGPMSEISVGPQAASSDPLAASVAKGISSDRSRSIDGGAPSIARLASSFSKMLTRSRSASKARRLSMAITVP